MASPIVFAAAVSGLPLSGTDYNNNWALVESSLLDLGAVIVSGLVPTVGAGLGVNVSAGTALIGPQLTLAAFVIGGLTPSSVNDLYLLQTGQATALVSPSVQPAGSVKLGQATTSLSAVTSVNAGLSSGRQQLVATYNLIPGGPAAGPASAGHLGSINLATWAAAPAEGVSVYGTLPGSAVGTGAALFAPVATKTANYTLTGADRTIRANANGGAFTLTLPDATTLAAGFPYLIKKVDASVFTVTITPNGVQTIDGAANYILTNAQQAVILYDTGSNWEIA